MTRRPTIAVVMPVYNAERWVAESLRSVLEQTDPPDEVIVVDDGSTDGSVAVIAGFGDRVRLIRQENRGVSGAFDRGIRAATSDYVAPFCADDLSVPERFARQRETLARHPEVDVAFGHLTFFEGKTGDYARPPFEGLVEPAAFLPEMYRLNLVGAPTVVLRRALYLRLGGYRQDIRVEDYEFWLRALSEGARFFYDPHPLAAHRVHATNNSGPSLANAELGLQIHRWYADRVGRRLAGQVLAMDQRVIARRLLEDGRPGEARRAYAASVRSWPSLRALAAALALSLPGGSRVGARRAAGSASAGDDARRRPA